MLSANRLRWEIAGEWLLAVGGLASVVLGAILIARPRFGQVTTTYVLGTYGIVFRVVLVLLGIRLRYPPRTHHDRSFQIAVPTYLRLAWFSRDVSDRALVFRDPHAFPSTGCDAPPLAALSILAIAIASSSTIPVRPIHFAFSGAVLSFLSLARAIAIA